MDIMNMGVQEILLIPVFADLAREAFEANKVVRERYNSAFGIGKTEIPVYKTESLGEYYGYGYLTIDGIFKYRDNWWGGREYEFSCDPDSIYKMLRSCYLREAGLSELDPERFDCQIEHIDNYFREFVKESSEVE